MATVIDWPVGVPSCIMPLSAQGGLRDNRLSFDTDSKLNPIERPGSSWAPEVYSVELTPLSVAQFEEFQRWYADDLRFGALPFYWSHPITGEPGVWKIQKADPPYRVNKRGLIPTGSSKRRVGLSFSVMSVPLDYWQNYIGSLFDGGQAGFWADNFAPSSRRVYKDTGSLIAAPGETARIVLGRAGGKAEQATSGARPTLGRAPITGRRNLITYSEEWGNAAWTKTRSSVTANAAPAPDGTYNANKIVEDATATSTHAVGWPSVSFASGERYTASVYFKAAERAFARLSLPSAAFTSNLYAHFDLTSGTVNITSAAATSGMEDIGNGWWRCWVSATATATAAGRCNAFLGIGPLVGDITYTGDGVSGLYAWGGQVESSASPTDYQSIRSAFDITESGIPDVWYLFDDGGDSLPLTLPAGTYGLAHWNEAAQLTIGTVTNPSDALVAERMAGIILRAGAFSAEDQAKIAAYVSSLNPS